MSVYVRSASPKGGNQTKPASAPPRIDWVKRKRHARTRNSKKNKKKITACLFVVTASRIPGFVSKATQGFRQLCFLRCIGSASHQKKNHDHISTSFYHILSKAGTQDELQQEQALSQPHVSAYMYPPLIFENFLFFFQLYVYLPIMKLSQ